MQENGQKQRELSYTGADGVAECFTSEDAISEKRDHLQYKLGPEQIVIAMQKAEEDTSTYIKEY
jgi:hypothetical protein